MFVQCPLAIAAAAVIAVAAAAAAASVPPVESQAKSTILPLTQVSDVKSIKNLVEKGQARINTINGVRNRPTLDVISDPITNADVFYVAPITIGGTVWNLLVDTGTGNTWCGAHKPCEKTSTGEPTGGHVKVSYGYGSFSGLEYTDVVGFGSLSATGQSIGAASSASGFSGVDGVLGLGPADLTMDTVSNAGTVPTYVDTLYKEGLISIEVVGIYFHPESGSDTDDTNGELTFGGVDTSKFSGTLTYFPTLKSGPAAPYWGLAITSFSYGLTILSSSASGIIDTGTTLIYIPTAAYNKFLSITGGKTDSSSGLATFTTMPSQNFSIKFGSTTYTLTPAQYLIPPAQYGFFDLASGKYYSWINNGGSSGVNTIIGQKFLENYYSVYDTTNSRVGFATRT